MNLPQTCFPSLLLEIHRQKNDNVAVFSEKNQQSLDCCWKTRRDNWYLIITVFMYLTVMILRQPCDELAICPGCNPAFAPWQLGSAPADPHNTECRRKQAQRIEGWMDFRAVSDIFVSTAHDELKIKEWQKNWVKHFTPNWLWQCFPVTEHKVTLMAFLLNATGMQCIGS